MKRAGIARAALAVIAAVVFAPACADEEILLAHVPPQRGGQDPGASRCTDTKDCSRSGYCEKAACDDVGGTCEPRPVVCDEQPRPVCGCDGITYWNDCLRRAAGVPAASQGECGKSAIACGMKRDPNRPPGTDPGSPGPLVECPAGAICARLLPFGTESPTPSPDDCPVDVLGTCWSLPAVCPTADLGVDRWTACGVANARCVTTCEAIMSGEVHKRAKACP